MEEEENSYDVENLLGDPSSQEDIADNLHAEDEDAASTAEMADEENSYDVEKLLLERRQKNGIYYLVRWKGYSPIYDSWVHEIDVGQDLVDELHASVDNDQKTRSSQENERKEACK